MALELKAAIEFPKLEVLSGGWRPASWDDYVARREALAEGAASLFFYQGKLLSSMSEGINHARFNTLLGIVFFIWFSLRSQSEFDSLSGCLLEKPGVGAASPDLVLYVGDGFPQWHEGESRYVNLTEWRVPDLVGEVGDTTIATDLDEKKRLYASLGVPEYWVVDVLGARVLAFRLDAGEYQGIEVSEVLDGLPIALLGEMLERVLAGEPNGRAAKWFSDRVLTLKR